jgi:hypothetical protein
MHWCFEAFSVCDPKSPHALGRTPVDPFDQHRKLRWRKSNAAFESHHPRPDECAVVEQPGEQTQPVPVPEKDVDKLGFPTSESEEMT